jgi:hypothetical protein
MPAAIGVAVRDSDAIPSTTFFDFFLARFAFCVRSSAQRLHARSNTTGSGTRASTLIRFQLKPHPFIRVNPGLGGAQ